MSSQERYQPQHSVETQEMDTLAKAQRFAENDELFKKVPEQFRGIVLSKVVSVVDASPEDVANRFKQLSGAENRRHPFARNDDDFMGSASEELYERWVTNPNKESLNVLREHVAYREVRVDLAKAANYVPGGRGASIIDARAALTGDPDFKASVALTTKAVRNLLHSSKSV